VRKILYNQTESVVLLASTSAPLVKNQERFENVKQIDRKRDRQIDGQKDKQINM
jgi:hypothetical protein